MAIFHFSVQVISRAAGRSSVSAAAYRAGERLHDERLDRDHDFRARSGVEHSEILLPEGAPEQWRDRERLWNDVEAFEKRKDAQLAREVEFALPRELTKKDNIKLARAFVKAEFVEKGMIAVGPLTPGILHLSLTVPIHSHKSERSIFTSSNGGDSWQLVSTEEIN